jgi:glycosyltransferase involved in cell wall biosynthesis
MNTRKTNRVFLRYWGSHFKSPRQVQSFLSEFGPLLARGWACWLILEREPENRDWIQPLIASGIRIEFISRPRSNYDLRAFFRIYQFFRRLRPIIIACDNIAVIPLLAAFLAGVPVRLWTNRNMDNYSAELRNPSFREKMAISLRLSCWAATRIFAVSSPVRDEMVAAGISPSKIWIRFNPRKLGAIPPILNRDDIRSKYSLSPTDIVIINVGHAIPVKGWDILIRAFAQTRSASKNIRLLLVGSFSSPSEIAFHEELKSLIVELKIGGSVGFTGHVSDVVPLLRSADIFALPSRSEGFSLALVEAIETGLPCVAASVGIAPDVIRHGVNGFLFQPGDHVKFAELLHSLVRDESLRRKLSENAVVPACIPTLEEYAEQRMRDYVSLLPAGF